MNTAIKYWLLFFIPVFLFACASSEQAKQGQSPKEGRYYTSAHPSRNISAQLERIQQSVKRISATAIYQTYYFDDLSLRPEQLKYLDIQKLATRYVTFNRSTAGTAFIIGRSNHHVALLSCAHVVSFPDTLISFVNDGSMSENSVISSVSIRKHQSNLIYNLPQFRTFEIVAKNNLKDLALLAVELTDSENLYAPPLPIKMGDPKDLRLGSYVMVLGYPKGNPMVTGGIVSDANRSSDGGFLTDALFNHGISGGVIMATRDNYKSFEWVGIANSTSATREMQLVPNPLTVDSYQPFEPYEDSIYVQQKTYITYGITQAIPVAKVIDFLRENDNKLNRLGISTERIISSN